MKKTMVRSALLLVILQLFLLSACGGGGGGQKEGLPYTPPLPQINWAPIISSTAGANATVNAEYLYQVAASDADGDALTYSLEIFPVGMVITAVTGIISWTPLVGQVGDHQVKIKVSDGKIAVYQEYTLTVSLPPANTGPLIISDPVTTATSEVEYTYTVKADDLENDTLTYSLVTFPSGMIIDPVTGKITWTPTLVQFGNHKIEVSVTDGEFSDTQKFAIRVIPSDNGIFFQRGCTLTSWWYNDYEQLKTKQTVDQMKVDGCEVIAILVTQYQDTINSTVIYPVASKTPTDTGIIQIITYAHSLGLKVALKPHIDPWSGAWRGEIVFTLEADWLAWFSSYTTFINHYLEMAEANSVEIFILGTEYKATEFREANWRVQITNARAKFSGLISYGANHDSYFNILWWDALDFIGVDAYFPLTTSYTPTVTELKTAWLPYLSALQIFAAARSQDIVFIEFGYQSYDGTNITPWWAPTTTTDLQEQADCYQAIMETFYNQSWFKGMYGWKWYWDPNQSVDKFDVYGKPAELILRDWYAGY